MHDSSHSDDTPQSLGDLERAAAERPDDAKALVALANAYWLPGSGPEAVSDLASRAMAADPMNRAAWHLWALAESDPRQRVARWQQVSARFPTDDLARANVADNAAALAGAEHDYDALDLAIATYEQLLANAEHPDQRHALETAIRTLRAWEF
jgi:tetratricopeptide (TPR) repeat protein